MRGLRLTRVRGVPRAGEVLGFGELVWSQLLCDAVAISIHIPEVEPHMGTHIVLRHTATFGEGGPEAVLRASIPLLRRQSEPMHRVGIILRHAPTSRIRQPEFVLRRGMALFSRQSKPTHRCSVDRGV